ncbi:hypothetical protein N7462_005106 [Penicillium macrosclerotiorum]|uniref:uncharacterized protein n=1 Tax=Penicillium macrosclerotiorum TaxID=303699 RepID=UPI002549346C|nr:uncharacterized protein N7462_005106 [Penicillium macrosclerotiorum]KAJ5690714.1 hypothetical protein N7462_005106 [Penicillium macrosclerotiorum]
MSDQRESKGRPAGQQAPKAVPETPPRRAPASEDSSGPSEAVPGRPVLALAGVRLGADPLVCCLFDAESGYIRDEPTRLAVDGMMGGEFPGFCLFHTVSHSLLAMIV